MGMSELTKDVKTMNAISKKFDGLGLTSQAYLLDSLQQQFQTNRRANWEKGNSLKMPVPMDGSDVGTTNEAGPRNAAQN